MRLADAPEIRLLRVGRRAMACRFEVLASGAGTDQAGIAIQALDLVDELEAQLSVYRPDSELAHVNRCAAAAPVAVERRLFDLLRLAADMERETSGAFDITIGPLVHCWGFYRRQGRLPDDRELAEARSRVGMGKVELNAEARTVRFQREGMQLNLGAIGKGHALDRAAELLRQADIENAILHGGYSSMLALGSPDGQAGWPVGIRHPLLPGRRLATVLLRDGGLATSGSGEQFFRHQGRRYSHLLDPRSGRPVEGMLSTTVLAPTAAEADALATAFFVLGVEGARRYCASHPEVGALLVPEPQRGGPLEIVPIGLQPDVWHREDAGAAV